MLFHVVCLSLGMVRRHRRRWSTRDSSPLAAAQIKDIVIIIRRKYYCISWLGAPTVPTTGLTVRAIHWNTTTESSTSRSHLSFGAQHFAHVTSCNTRMRVSLSLHFSSLRTDILIWSNSCANLTRKPKSTLFLHTISALSVFVAFFFFPSSVCCSYIFYSSVIFFISLSSSMSTSVRIDFESRSEPSERRTHTHPGKIKSNSSTAKQEATSDGSAHNIDLDVNRNTHSRILGPRV